MKRNACLILFTCLIASSVMAQIPQRISFQGYLTQPGTTIPIDNGEYPMDFSLYDADVEGTLLWTESQTNVSVTNGIFNVQLGSVNGLDPEIFTGSTWLEIVVNSEIMTPRIEMSTSPYSQMARGILGESYIPNTGNSYIGGNQSVGGTTPTVDLAIDDEDTGIEVPADGTLSFYTNGVEQAVLDPLGHFNLGFSPDSRFKFTLLTQGSNSDENNWSMYVENQYSGPSLAMGIYNYIGGASTNVKYGYFMDMFNSGASTSYGFYSSHFGTTTGTKYGFYAEGEDRNYFSGSVGIGTTNPVEKLSVSGNIASSATIKANAFEYNTPKTQYYSIPPNDYVVASPSATLYEYIPANGIYNAVGGGTTGVAVSMVAPVHLPDGAIITGFKAGIFDGDATNNLNVQLMRQSMGSISTPVAVATSNTSSGNLGFAELSATGLSIPVNNELFAYTMRFNTYDNNPSNLVIYVTRITYTVPGP